MTILGLALGLVAELVHLAIGQGLILVGTRGLVMLKAEGMKLRLGQVRMQAVHLLLEKEMAR